MVFKIIPMFFNIDEIYILMLRHKISTGYLRLATFVGIWIIITKYIYSKIVLTLP